MGQFIFYIAFVVYCIDGARGFFLLIKSYKKLYERAMHALFELNFGGFLCRKYIICSLLTFTLFSSQ